MNALELKQKIIDKLKSVNDVDLLKQILQTLQPVHPNENELEMAKEDNTI